MKLKLSAFLVAALLSPRAHAESRIINGVPVPPGHFTEVVEIEKEGAHCSATVVGPRAVLTAGHCANTGAHVTFGVDGKRYNGTAYRHPLFQGKDVDVSLVITSEKIQNVKPVPIGPGVDVGQDVFFLGFGCTNPGGGGGNDGILRIGGSTVASFSDYDFVSKRADGSALCFGDSGGPTYVKTASGYRIVGVSSKGNIVDINYSAYLSMPEVRNFLSQTAAAQKIAICGLNSTCDEPQVSGAPEFKEKVIPITLSTTQAMVVSLAEYLKTDVQGLRWTLDPQAPEWVTLDDGGQLGLCPPSGLSGAFKLSVVAQNQHGVAATMVALTLAAAVPAPTCTLTATPQFVTQGEVVRFHIESDQPILFATIDGNDLNDHSDLAVTQPESGVFVAKGKVVGASGTGYCTARYAVK